MERNYKALCCKCGAALQYPVEVIFTHRKTGAQTFKTYGVDCFETEFGSGAKFDIRDGKYDQAEVEARREERKAKLAEEEAAWASRIAATTEANQWLIDELKPFGMVCTSDWQGNPQYNGAIMDNFAGSIIQTLQNGYLATTLPLKAKRIICGMVAKRYGRANSKAYNAKHYEISEKLEAWEK